MSGRIPKRVKMARLKNNSNQIGLKMQGNGNTVGNRPMINKKINKRVNTNTKIGCVNNGKLTGKMAGFRNGKQICVDNKNYQLIPQAPRSRACAGGVGQIRNTRCVIQNSKISSQSEPEPGDEWPPLRDIMADGSLDLMWTFPMNRQGDTETGIIDLLKWGGVEVTSVIRQFGMLNFSFRGGVNREKLLAVNPQILESFEKLATSFIDTGLIPLGSEAVGQLTFLFPPSIKVLDADSGKGFVLKDVNMLSHKQHYNVKPLVRCIWKLSHAATDFEDYFDNDEEVMNYTGSPCQLVMPLGANAYKLGFRRPVNGMTAVDPKALGVQKTRLGTQYFPYISNNLERMINTVIKLSGLDRKEFSLKLHNLSIIFKSTIVSYQHLT